MTVIADINPYAAVLDYRAEGGDTEDFVKNFLEEGKKPELLDDNGETIIVEMGRKRFELEVKRALGGNQMNTAANLELLAKWTPGLKVEKHFGLKDESGQLKVVRKSLYAPGLKSKIDLVSPQEVGDIIFERPDLDEKNIIISSSPHGEMGKPYWEAFRDFLETNKSSGIYWNPGTVQIAGTVDRKLLAAMKGRVSIMQLNEKEAAGFMRNYLGGEHDISRLATVVNSDWTVVTRGAEGLGVYANGEYYPHGLSDIGKKGKGDDVGCGDAVFAAFIAIKEALKGMPMEAATEMASIIGAYQFSNPESNLANYFRDEGANAK